MGYGYTEANMKEEALSAEEKMSKKHSLRLGRYGAKVAHNGWGWFTYYVLINTQLRP